MSVTKTSEFGIESEKRRTSVGSSESRGGGGNGSSRRSLLAFRRCTIDSLRSTMTWRAGGGDLAKARGPPQPGGDRCGWVLSPAFVEAGRPAGSRSPPRRRGGELVRQ